MYSYLEIISQHVSITTGSYLQCLEPLLIKGKQPSGERDFPGLESPSEISESVQELLTGKWRPLVEVLIEHSGVSWIIYKQNNVF